MNKCIKCGSYAFNLYKDDIDQGGLCDVHYWQGRAHRAEALAEQPAQQEPYFKFRECEDSQAGQPKEPEQEPVAPSIDDAYEMGAKGGPTVEAERLAFEAWMRGHCWALCATWDGKGYRSDAEQSGNIDPHAMRTRQLWAAWRDRAALAVQPEQESVAINDTSKEPVDEKAKQRHEQEPVAWEVGVVNGVVTRRLASTVEQPQRTWVGLTDEERITLFEKYGHRTGVLVGAVEDKLKELNT